MTPTPFDPWLLAAALAPAIALAPWAALLGLGLAVYVGFGPTPSAISAFSSPWLALPSILLLATGAAVRTRDGPWLLWEAMHLPVRLFLAASLLLLVAEGGALGTVGPFVSALGLGALVTFLRWGWALSAEGAGHRPTQRTGAGSSGLAALAAILAFGAVALPLPSASAAILLVLLAWGLRPRGLGAGRTAIGMLPDMILSPIGLRGWRDGSALPRWLHGGLAAAFAVGSADGPDPGGLETERDALPRPPDPQGSIGGTPALLVGDDPAGARGGWLVVAGGRGAFLYRTPTRVWSIALGETRRWRRLDAVGPLLDRRRLTSPGGELVLAVARGTAIRGHTESEGVRSPGAATVPARDL